MKSTVNIFNKEKHKKNKERARKNFSDHDFLYRISSQSIIERVDAFNKEFDNVLVYGDFIGDLPKCKNITYVNIVPGTGILQADEESLDFEDGVFDLIISNLSLHFVNDVEAVMRRYLKILSPGGAFVGVFIGGNTLANIRNVLRELDIKFFNGISSRIIPMIEVKDAGRLIQKSGFSMSIADSEEVLVSYEHVINLFRDIKGMGQGSCMVLDSCKPLTKGYLKALNKELLDGSELMVIFDLIGITGIRSIFKKDAKNKINKKKK